MHFPSLVTTALAALSPSLATHLAQAAPSPRWAPGPEYTILVGSYGGQFHAIKFTSGIEYNTLEVLASSSEAGAGPSWATWFPDNPTSIYISDDHGQAGTENVVQLAWDPAANQFSRISTGSTGLDGTVHLAVSKLPGVSCIYAAGYGSGSVSAQALGTDSIYAETLQLVDPALVTFQGSGPNPDKQASPHAHQVVEDEYTGVFYVPDLGTDTIHRLTLDSADECVLKEYAGGLEDIPVNAGSGPRHLIVHREDVTGYAYLVNELSNTVEAFEISNDDGGLTLIGDSLDIAPQSPFDLSALAASEIALSPDASFLYAGLRHIPQTDDDLIALIGRDPSTGGLTGVIEHLASGGKNPRHLSISADGNYIVVANQGSDGDGDELKNIAVLERHAETGLTQVVAKLAIPGGAVFAGFWEGDE